MALKLTLANFSVSLLECAAQYALCLLAVRLPLITHRVEYILILVSCNTRSSDLFLGRLGN